jgi:hypothetical protein
MEILKDTVIFIIVPLVAFTYKIIWNKCNHLETIINSCKGHDFCANVFGLKSEIATKKDIADILDAKFKEFELKLIKEKRINI